MSSATVTREQIYTFLQKFIPTAFGYVLDEQNNPNDEESFAKLKTLICISMLTDIDFLFAVQYRGLVKLSDSAKGMIEEFDKLLSDNCLIGSKSDGGNPINDFSSLNKALIHTVQMMKTQGLYGGAEAAANAKEFVNNKLQAQVGSANKESAGTIIKESGKRIYDEWNLFLSNKTDVLNSAVNYDVTKVKEEVLETVIMPIADDLASMINSYVSSISETEQKEIAELSAANLLSISSIIESLIVNPAVPMGTLKFGPFEDGSTTATNALVKGTAEILPFKYIVKTLLKIFSDYYVAVNDATTPAAGVGATAQLFITGTSFDFSGQSGKSFFIEIDRDGDSVTEFEITYAMIDAGSSNIAAVTYLELENIIYTNTSSMLANANNGGYIDRVYVRTASALGSRSNIKITSKSDESILLAMGVVPDTYVSGSIYVNYIQTSGISLNSKLETYSAETYTIPYYIYAVGHGSFEVDYWSNERVYLKGTIPQSLSDVAFLITRHVFGTLVTPPSSMTRPITTEYPQGGTIDAPWDEITTGANLQSTCVFEGTGGIMLPTIKAWGTLTNYRHASTTGVLNPRTSTGTSGITRAPIVMGTDGAIGRKYSDYTGSGIRASGNGIGKIGADEKSISLGTGTSSTFDGVVTLDTSYNRSFFLGLSGGDYTPKLGDYVHIYSQSSFASRAETTETTSFHETTWRINKFFNLSNAHANPRFRVLPEYDSSDTTNWSNWSDSNFGTSWFANQNPNTHPHTELTIDIYYAHRFYSASANFTDYSATVGDYLMVIPSDVSPVAWLSYTQMTSGALKVYEVVNIKNHQELLLNTGWYTRDQTDFLDGVNCISKANRYRSRSDKFDGFFGFHAPSKDQEPTSGHVFYLCKRGTTEKQMLGQSDNCLIDDTYYKFKDSNATFLTDGVAEGDYLVISSGSYNSASIHNSNWITAGQNYTNSTYTVGIVEGEDSIGCVKNTGYDASKEAGYRHAGFEYHGTNINYEIRPAQWKRILDDPNATFITSGMAVGNRVHIYFYNGSSVTPVACDVAEVVSETRLVMAADILPADDTKYTDVKYWINASHGVGFSGDDSFNTGATVSSNVVMPTINSFFGRTIQSLEIEQGDRLFLLDKDLSTGSPSVLREYYIIDARDDGAILIGDIGGLNTGLTTITNLTMPYETEFCIKKKPHIFGGSLVEGALDECSQMMHSSNLSSLTEFPLHTLEGFKRRLELRVQGQNVFFLFSSECPPEVTPGTQTNRYWWPLYLEDPGGTTITLTFPEYPGVTFYRPTANQYGSVAEPANKGLRDYAEWREVENREAQVAKVGGEYLYDSDTNVISLSPSTHLVTSATIVNLDTTIGAPIRGRPIFDTSEQDGNIKFGFFSGDGVKTFYANSPNQPFTSKYERAELIIEPGSDEEIRRKIININSTSDVTMGSPIDTFFNTGVPGDTLTLTQVGDRLTTPVSEYAMIPKAYPNVGDEVVIGDFRSEIIGIKEARNIDWLPVRQQTITHNVNETYNSGGAIAFPQGTSDPTDVIRSQTYLFKAIGQNENTSCKIVGNLNDFFTGDGFTVAFWIFSRKHSGYHNQILLRCWDTVTNTEYYKITLERPSNNNGRIEIAIKGTGGSGQSRVMFNNALPEAKRMQWVHVVISFSGDLSNITTDDNLMLFVDGNKKSISTSVLNGSGSRHTSFDSDDALTIFGPNHTLTVANSVRTDCQGSAFSHLGWIKRGISETLCQTLYNNGDFYPYEAFERTIDQSNAPAVLTSDDVVEYWDFVESRVSSREKTTITENNAEWLTDAWDNQYTKLSCPLFPNNWTNGGLNRSLNTTEKPNARFQGSMYFGEPNSANADTLDRYQQCTSGNNFYTFEDGAASATFSFWLKLNSDAVSRRILTVIRSGYNHNAANRGNDNQIYVEIDPPADNTITVHMPSSAGSNILVYTAPSNFYTNWMMLSFSWTGVTQSLQNEFKLYVNGSLLTPSSTTINNTSTAGYAMDNFPKFFGHFRGTHNYESRTKDGEMDGCYIAQFCRFHKVLSDSDINELYNSGVGINPFSHSNIQDIGPSAVSFDRGLFAHEFAPENDAVAESDPDRYGLTLTGYKGNASLKSNEGANLWRHWILFTPPHSEAYTHSMSYTEVVTLPETTDRKGVCYELSKQYPIKYSPVTDYAYIVKSGVDPLSYYINCTDLVDRKGNATFDKGLLSTPDLGNLNLRGLTINLQGTDVQSATIDVIQSQSLIKTKDVLKYEKTKVPFNIPLNFLDTVETFETTQSNSSVTSSTAKDDTLTVWTRETHTIAEDPTANFFKVSPYIISGLSNQIYAVTKGGSSYYGYYEILKYLINKIDFTSISIDIYTRYLSEIIHSFESDKYQIGSVTGNLVGTSAVFSVSDGIILTATSNASFFSDAQVGDKLTLVNYSNSTHTLVETYIKSKTNNSTVIVFHSLSEAIVYGKIERSAVSYSILQSLSLRKSLQDFVDIIEQYPIISTESANTVIETLEENGMDNAIDTLIMKGITEFLALDRREASSSGAFAKALEEFGETLFRGDE